MRYETEQERQKRHAAKLKRVEEAWEEFGDAATLAEKHGLQLVRKVANHYQLSRAGEGWLINLYPSNFRLYADRNRPRAPFLNVKRPWTLVDVVTTAIDQEQAKGKTTSDQR